MSKHCLHLILIAAIGLMFFLPLLQSPTDVLYSDHSDMLAMHLPMKFFSVSSFQETGELPRWCPFSFSGMPFIHDVQVAPFYPLHWPLYWMPPALVGAAMSWLVVLHVLLAGVCMYAYARATELTATGALAAALGWMLAGKWMLHILEGGHYILTPLAWLPLVMWLLWKAVGARHWSTRCAWTMLSGLLFGVIALGTHPQITFYSGIGIALWMLVQASFGVADFRASRIALALFCGAVCALVAVGVAAVQLLPAMEATPYTTRASGVAAADILSGGMRTLVNTVGPATVAPTPNVRWEDRGGFAVISLLMALFAVGLRTDPQPRRHAWLALILIVFALGGALLVQWLPGFRLFRQPSRMLLIAALPISWLAGAGVEAFASATADHAHRLKGIAIRLFVAVGILSGGLSSRSLIMGESLLFHPYWLSLAVSMPTIWLMLKRMPLLRSPWSAPILVGVLLIDLLALTMPSVAVRPVEEVYPEGTITRRLHELAGPGDRILERDESVDSLNSPLGTGAPMALLHGLESVRGYNSFDVASYRTYLKRISRDPAPLRPFEDVWTFPLVGNFPLQDRLLVDLLCIRYLIQPADHRVPSGWTSVPGGGEERPRGYNLIDGGVREMTAFAIHQNETVLPRAFLIPVQAVEVGAEGNVSLDILARDRELMRPAAVVDYRPNTIKLTAEVTEPSFLVLADAAYPGWQCHVDGRPVDIKHAQEFFRAVRVDPGDGTIQFSFRPHSFRVGRAVSAITLLLVGATLWCAIVSTRRGRSSQRCHSAATTTVTS